jgi:hypothetical protein
MSGGGVSEQPGLVRRGLRGTRQPTLRSATPLPQAQRLRGTSPADPQGGVLCLLQGCSRSAQPEQSTAPLGAGLRYDPASSFPWQKAAGAVSSGVLPQLGPGDLTVSYVLDEHNVRVKSNDNVTELQWVTQLIMLPKRRLLGGKKWPGTVFGGRPAPYPVWQLGDG